MADNAADEAASTRLSRQLWFRRPGSAFRFRFDPSSSPGLALEPVGRPDGGTTGRAFAAATPQATHGAKAVIGVVLVGQDNRLTFCSSEAPASLCGRISDWCRAAADSMPAVSVLVDADFLSAELDWSSDGAIDELRSGMAPKYSDPRAWWGVVTADATSVGKAVAERLPGERMWYWLRAVDDPGGATPVPPLVLQAVSSDPNRDRMNLLMRLVERVDDGATASGVCYFADDGVLEFVGPDLTRAHLLSVAAWLLRHAADVPDLARLARCRMVRTSGGAAAEIIADPDIWGGLAPPPAPGSLAETASVLRAARPGADYWFWMTATCPEGAFVTLMPVGDDEDGARFRSRAAMLFRRFEGSFADAISGVVRVQTGLRLVFASPQADTAHWRDTMRSLAVLLRGYGVELGTATLTNGSGRGPVTWSGQAS